MNTYFSFLQVVTWCNNVRDASWLSPILFWWSSNNLQKGLIVIFICLISSLSVESGHLVSFNVMQIYFVIMRDAPHIMSFSFCCLCLWCCVITCTYILLILQLVDFKKKYDFFCQQCFMICSPLSHHHSVWCLCDVVL